MLPDNRAKQQAVEQYIRDGWSAIPVPAGAKNPNRDGWQHERHPVEAVPELWNNGQNTGVILGEASGGLVDVDLDTPEARAVARYILPRTKTSGRAGAPSSHSFYYADGPIPKTKQYKLAGKGDDRSIVELRSTGGQTIIPPSVHPSDEAIEWSDASVPVARVNGDELAQAVGDVATAALLLGSYPGQGARHDFILAATGYIGRRLPRKRAERIMRGAIAASGDEDRDDRERAVSDTLDRLARNEPTTGGPALDDLAPGVVAQLDRWHKWTASEYRTATLTGTPSADGTGTGHREFEEDELPRIVTNNRNLRDVTNDALDALVAYNAPPRVFVRSGELVRVREDENGIPGIQSMDLGAVRGRLARTADFVRVSKDGEARVNPPEIVVKDLMALDGWPFPPLEAVVETPILRPDGTISDTPGYDPETRLVYHPAGYLDLPKINETPTPEEVRGALDLINEAVGEFPYADTASTANTLALLLTPIVRQAVNGPVPLALIDKPQAGTGGSLLAETVAVIGSGRAAEMLGAPGDDEEWRKLITAKLSAGTTAITIDNVDGPLFAPSLARALTARTWTDRVLGRSEVVTVSQRATWVATGNNIILRGDLPRRCYYIRLDAKASRPWQRDGFKHPNLIEWVTANRIKLVHALLTIARGWFAAGKPKAANVPRLGSFESWAETVGGIIAFAGVSGFLSNLTDLYDKADESGAEWEAFLESWWNHQGDDPTTGKELTRLIREHAALRHAVPGDLAETLEKSEGSFTRQLGHALSKRAGTRFGDDGLHVENTGELRRAKLWSVRKGSDSCEFVSFVSSYNPSACSSESANTSNTPTGSGEINSNNSQTHTRTPAPVEPVEPQDETTTPERWG